MTVILPRARMGTVERYAAACGLVAAGLVVGAAAALAGGHAWVSLLIGAAAGLGLALMPARGLEYRLGPRSLEINSLVLPLDEIASVRAVRLQGVVVYPGITLPGFWYGRAWAPHLGRVLLRGSIGLGQGVLVTMTDGRRVVITPADAQGAVVRLQVHLHNARRGP